MKQELKENKFKPGVLLIFLIIGCSVAYYFVAMGASRSAKVGFELQEKCAKLAGEFFSKNYTLPSGGGYHVNYECHYNKKLNKCFILVTDELYYDNNQKFVEHHTLKDILANKVYGSYTHETGLKDIFMMDDKICSSDVWHRQAKKYMEE